MEVTRELPRGQPSRSTHQEVTGWPRFSLAWLSDPFHVKSVGWCKPMMLSWWIYSLHDDYISLEYLPNNWHTVRRICQCGGLFAVQFCGRGWGTVAWFMQNYVAWSLDKNCIFQCMGKVFCVELQRYPLKFHTKYLTHTLKDVYFIDRQK